MLAQASLPQGGRTSTPQGRSYGSSESRSAWPRPGYSRAVAAALRSRTISAVGQRISRGCARSAAARSATWPSRLVRSHLAHSRTGSGCHARRRLGVTAFKRAAAAGTATVDVEIGEGWGGALPIPRLDRLAGRVRPDVGFAELRRAGDCRIRRVAGVRFGSERHAPSVHRATNDAVARVVPDADSVRVRGVGVDVVAEELCLQVALARASRITDRTSIQR